MADAFETLLLRMGIDLSGVRQAGADIKTILDQVNAQAKLVTAGTKQALAEQAVLQAQAKTAATQAVEAAKAAIAAENAKAAASKAQTSELQAQIQAQKLAAQEALRGLDVEKQKTEILRQQSQQLELQNKIKKQQNQQNNPNAGGGGAGNIGGQFAKAVLGQGLAGGVAAGVLAGAGIGQIIKGAVDEVSALIDKFKQLLIESSKLTQVEDIFERLSKGAGVDSTVMLSKLQEATEGLVDKLTLLKLANTALRKEIPVEKVTALSHAVTVLAESGTGRVRSVEQAMGLLNRALETGNARMLTMQLGIDRAFASGKGLAPGLSAMQRQAATSEQVFNEILRRAKQIGEIPNTIQNATQRVSIAQNDLLKSFGVGLQRAPGFQLILASLGDTAKRITDLQGRAEELGKKIGDALGAIVTAAAPLKDAFGAFGRALSNVIESAGNLYRLATGIINVKTSTSEAVSEFERLHPILADIVKSVFLLSGAVKEVGKGIEYVSDQAAKATRHPVDYVQQKSSNILPIFAGGFAKALGFKRPANRASDQEISDTLSGTQPQVPNSFMGPLQQTQTRKEPTFQEQYEEFIRNFGAGGKTGTDIPPGAAADTGANAQDARKLAQEKMQEAREAAQFRLAQHKSELEEEKEVDNEFYRSGQETLKEHTDKQIAIVQEGAKAQRDEYIAAYAAMVKDLAEQLNLGLLKQQDYQVKLQTETNKLNRQMVTSATSAQRQINALQRQALADATAAQIKQLSDEDALLKKQSENRIKAAQRNVQLQQDSLNSERALNEAKFNQGAISPEENAAKEENIIKRETELQIDSANKIAGEKQQQAAADIATASQQLLLEHQTETTRVAAQKKIEDAKELSNDAELTRIDSIVKAIQKQYEAEIKGLETLGTKSVQYYEKNFQAQQSFLKELVEYQQQLPGGADNSQVEELQQRQLKSIQAYRTALESAANRPEVQAMPDLWNSVLLKIEGSYEAEAKLNQELQNTRDYLIPVAAGFDNLGKAIGSVIKSKFGQDLAATISVGVKSLQDAGKLSDQIGGISNAPKKDSATIKLEAQATTLFDNVAAGAKPVITVFDQLAKAGQAVIDNFLAKLGVPGAQKSGTDADPIKVVAPLTLPAGTQQVSTPPPVQPGTPQVGGIFGLIGSIFHRTPKPPKVGASRDAGDDSEANEADDSGSGGGDSTTSFGDKVKTLGTQFSGLITAVSAFAQSVTSAHSAISGAVGGASGGAGLAGSLNIGGALGKLFPSLGGAAGPLGSLAGAGIGALVGAFTGSKANAVYNQIHTFEADFRDIMYQFSLNTNNLQNTIVQVQALMAQVAAQEASSKKGGSQFAQLFTQYQQQLQQLQAQQHQILVAMNEQLAVASAPLPAQSFLNDIEGILTKFQQYEGAASNIQDLANAYNYLNTAVQNYVQTSQSQLLQADTQAINDALQLNDLLYQQQQAILAYNNQVQGILSNGVLTRTATRAQTSGQQIQQLDVAYQRQQQQLNEQIAAETYKVQQEQHIFDLATTRIGLENQLLAAQNAQTNLDMQQLAMLQATIAALSSGNYSLLPGLLALLGAIPSITNPVGGTTPLSAIQALMSGGTGAQNATGTATLDSLFAAAYGNYGSLGFAQFRGTNLLP